MVFLEYGVLENWVMTSYDKVYANAAYICECPQSDTSIIQNSFPEEQFCPNGWVFSNYMCILPVMIVPPWNIHDFVCL